VRGYGRSINGDQIFGTQDSDGFLRRMLGVFPIFVDVFPVLMTAKARSTICYSAMNLKGFEEP
jgi:hypothetical protein